MFNTLDLYLEIRHGFMYANFGDAPTSRQLSQARGSDWLVLPAASAIELLAALDVVECEAGDVTVGDLEGPRSIESDPPAPTRASTAWHSPGITGHAGATNLFCRGRRDGAEQSVGFTIGTSREIERVGARVPAAAQSQLPQSLCNEGLAVGAVKLIKKPPLRVVSCPRGN